MRVIPVKNFVVTVTVKPIRGRGSTHWRGHWSVCRGQGDRPGSAMAEGDTDVCVSEENAYLFAGTEGVAIAKAMAIRISDR
jgi:hypothetical protein